MPRRIAFLPLLVVSLLLGAAAGPAGAETPGLNIFGFSHHLKNPWNDDLKEVNPGLGLTWTFARSGRGSLDGNVGVYADSYGHANYHLSLGGRLNVAGPVDLGLQVINAVSASLADGEPVITPYPFLATRIGRATWNVAYIPEVKSFNGLPTVATFVTVHPWGWGVRPADQPGAPGEGSTLEFTVPRVPALQGFHESGFMWRRNFDERRALRLGCRVTGYLRSAEMGSHDYGTDGNYEAALLAQYLVRQQPRGRLRTYWATGLEALFSTGMYSEERTREAWRSDLGVEYDLGRNLALALEYGLALRYGITDYGTQSRERSLMLDGTGARLALLVARPTQDHAADAAPQPRGNGPAVLLDADFHLSAFNAAAIAWQWNDGPHRAWRAQADVQFESTRIWPDERDQFALTLSLERLRRGTAAAGAAAPYWGIGPVLGYGYSHLRRASYEPESYPDRSELRRALEAGATALVGAEYRLFEGVSLLAEYSCDLTISITRYSDGYHSHGLGIDTNAARLGLALD